MILFRYMIMMPCFLVSTCRLSSAKEVRVVI